MSYLKRLPSALRNSLELDLVTRAYCFEQISNSRMLRNAEALIEAGEPTYGLMILIITLCAAKLMHLRVIKHYFSKLAASKFHGYEIDIVHIAIVAVENGDLKLFQFLTEEARKKGKTLACYGVIRAIVIYGFPHFMKLMDHKSTWTPHPEDMEICNSHQQVRLAFVPQH